MKMIYAVLLRSSTAASAVDTKSNRHGNRKKHAVGEKELSLTFLLLFEIQNSVLCNQFEAFPSHKLLVLASSSPQYVALLLYRGDQLLRFYGNLGFK
ncbi:unnamed protein product [Musa acuminata subsp. burmannicoides]